MSSVREYLLLHLVSCRAPAVPRIARNFDIFLPHNEFRLFLLPGNGDVFNSLFDQNLIPLRLQRLICVNKIRPLKQRLDAVSTKSVVEIRPDIKAAS